MLWVLTLLGLGVARANEILPIQVVLMCTTLKGDKQIALFKQGNNFIYQYGSSMASPELQLVRPSAEVILEPWNGIGRYIWNSITIKNKEYSYTVRASYDKIEDKSFGGVTISKGDTILASVECTTEANFIEQLEVVVR